jgi:hypothetical protein
MRQKMRRRITTSLVVRGSLSTAILPERSSL